MLGNGERGGLQCVDFLQGLLCFFGELKIQAEPSTCKETGQAWWVCEQVVVQVGHEIYS